MKPQPLLTWHGLQHLILKVKFVFLLEIKLGCRKRGCVKGGATFDFAFVRVCLHFLAFARVYLRFRSLVRGPEICVCLRLRAFVCVCKHPLLLHPLLRHPEDSPTIFSSSSRGAPIFQFSGRRPIFQFWGTPGCSITCPFCTVELRETQRCAIKRRSDATSDAEPYFK